jgi:hypothetical protein
LKKISGFFRKTLKRIPKKSKPEHAILYLTKQSMFMQNFSSLACSQTDLDTFLNICEENVRIFQENSLANLKNPNLSMQTRFMQNFSSLASTQTDLDKFMTIFEENFSIFQENTFANSKKFQTWVRNFMFDLAKHVHAKLQLSSF